MKNDKLIILITDYGRMHQRSFNISEIYRGIDLKKYKDVRHIVLRDEEHKLGIIKKATELNYDIKYVTLAG